jgi:UDP-3-O-[3-hydroxymyristoyl] N-acetylglucosamine deacetylase
MPTGQQTTGSQTTGLQTTLGQRVILTGIGVHSNVPVRIVLNPCDANTGVVFRRTGLPNSFKSVVEAKWSCVTMTELCTVIGDGALANVGTIEHLMAALSGLGLDNVLVEIDGPEVPIFDGSAAAFVQAIDAVGIVSLDAPRRFLKILKPVHVERGRAFCELLPSDDALHLDVEIDFTCGAIGKQKKALDINPSAFRRELARARTFGFLSDVERLWKAGFALGASLDNTIAVHEEAVLNPEGLRFPDEFVRHKMLDALGDLALAGAPILGTFRSYCGGHAMNVAVLEALFADASAYMMIEAQLPRQPRVPLQIPAQFSRAG